MKVEETGISKRMLEEAEERKKEKLAKDVEEDFLRLISILGYYLKKALTGEA